jgi:type II secretory pathway component PulF
MSATNFEYLAVDQAGAQRKGTITAATREEAYRKVAASGATPLRVRAARDKAGRSFFAKRVRESSVAEFTHQLSVLLEARIPIADGVRGIAEQEPNPTFRAALLDIAGRIQSGATVTSALTAHRRLFGDVFIETIHAAEQSGTMIRALEHLAEMLEQRGETSRHIKQALTYPCVVLVALGSAVTFMLVFVVPRFAQLFSERGVELPALTQALQALGESMRGFWWAWIAGLLGLLVALHRTWATTQGRAAIDRCLHRTPYLRRVLTGLAVGRFARVLGVSLGSGLGLIESLEMSGRASGRPMLMQDVERMMEQVRQGGRLSEVLRSCEYLPGFARRMIAAGEESAELPRLCNVVARHYERETNHLVKNASTVIEPLLIASLTGVVLVVALAIFMPMWDMVGLAG